MAKIFEKSITIKQKPKTSVREGDDQTEHFKKIGSSLKGQDVLRGLTREEEVILLPNLIGCDSKSPEFESQLRTYWNNISARVPFEGLILNIGITFKTEVEAKAFEEKLFPFEKAITMGGTPIHVGNYILWRYCLVYSKVSNSIETLYESPKIEFYIEDKGLELKANHDSLKIRNEARVEFAKLLSDHAKLRDIYTLIAREDESVPFYLSSMKDMELDINLDDVITKKPSLFLKYCKDINLTDKAFIEKCIVAGALRRVDNTEIIMAGEDVVGHTVEEAVLHIRDAKNKELKATLEARLKVAKT